MRRSLDRILLIALAIIVCGVFSLALETDYTLAASKPGKVKITKVTAGEKTVVLKWKAVKNSKGYQIYRAPGKSKSFKEYLYITYDIAEGRYAFFYADDWGRDNAWAHRFIRSYKESAIGMFKGFLKAVDESNKTNFSEQITAGFNEHQLVGKLVGLILAEEEYESNRGDIRKSLVVHRIVPIEKIRTGDYRVPGLKRLEVKNTSPAGFVPGSDNDLPF